MNKYEVSDILVSLFGLGCILAIIRVGWWHDTPEISAETAAGLDGSCIYASVAHVEYPYEKVYQLKDADVAFYYVPEEVTHSLQVADVVVDMRGNEHVVLSKSINGFTMTNGSCLYPGDSGSDIIDARGAIVGHVSALLLDDIAYCIWD